MRLINISGKPLPYSESWKYNKSVFETLLNWIDIPVFLTLKVKSSWIYLIEYVDIQILIPVLNKDARNISVSLTYLDIQLPWIWLFIKYGYSLNMVIY